MLAVAAWSLVRGCTVGAGLSEEAELSLVSQHCGEVLLNFFQGNLHQILLDKPLSASPGYSQDAKYLLQ